MSYKTRPNLSETRQIPIEFFWGVEGRQKLRCGVGTAALTLLTPALCRVETSDLTSCTSKRLSQISLNCEKKSIGRNKMLLANTT